MLTDNRKRRRGGDSEDDPQLNPQAKRSGGGPNLLVSDLGRDVWDSESSSSDSSGGGISSPERATLAGAGSNCISQNSLSSTLPDASAGSSLQGLHAGDGVSYDHINRVLREAHFSSLQTRGRPGST